MRWNRSVIRGCVCLAFLLALALLVACSSGSSSSKSTSSPNIATATGTPASAQLVPRATDRATEQLPAPTAEPPQLGTSPDAPPPTAPPVVSTEVPPPATATATRQPEGKPSATPQATGMQVRPGKDKDTRPQAPPSKPSPPADPLNQPYAPAGPKLAVPKPGPDYLLDLDISGGVSYVFAYDKSVRTYNEERHHVFTEPASRMPGMYANYMALSPDHRSVVYVTNVSWRTNQSRMWLTGVHGGGKRLLLDIPSEWWTASPVWSPDSKRIAYVLTSSPGKKRESVRTHLELWVMDADGSGNHKLMTHPSFNTSVFYNAEKNPLRWTPYGDLQYRDYQSGKIWTVDGNTGHVMYQKAAIREPKHRIRVIKTKHPIPIHSQNDPRWRDEIIGECDSMGNFGCALNATTMSFNANGIATDPSRINQGLDEFACPLYWTYASKYHSRNKLELWGDWAFDWNLLDLALKKGLPAMVRLSDHWDPDAAILNHWVLVVGGEGQTPDDYRIYDPWDGTTYKTLRYYTSKGYDLKKVFVYGPKTPKKPKPVMKSGGGKVKPGPGKAGGKDTQKPTSKPKPKP